MVSRGKQLAILLFAAAISAPGQTSAGGRYDRFKAIAGELASAPADPCTLTGLARPASPSSLEDQLFAATDAAILQALQKPVAERMGDVRSALNALQTASAEADKAWPEERRFHYKLLAVYPILIVEFGLRGRTTYSVFGVPELKPTGPRQNNEAWLEIASDPLRFGVHKGRDELETSALYQGPSRRARFLIHYTFAGCGDTPQGIAYKGYEWDPKYAGKMRLILDREGAVSGKMYAAVGELHTSGSEISLPYCWWSAVDESVWASLCSVDNYDLSGDLVRFLSTTTNRPDLEAVARAIEYGERRDVSALLGYSVDSETAEGIAQSMPAYIYPDVVAVEPDPANSS
ncbi:MAG: hypothetical protein ABI383_07025, partial [Acidobacteriaceae bacterium]